MTVNIRKFNINDLNEMIEIWNEVVKSGVAFPQKEFLDINSGKEFFNFQSFCGVAQDNDAKKIVGLYILHPNNIGRCGHICNASYAVASDARGNHIGESLVKHSMKTGKELGFKILQFNAVVKTNEPAIHLYKKLGFQQLGTIKGGFQLDNGNFEDIIPFYHTL
ncbi:MAG: GNAT family N-acetyltransferase [Ruminococcus sp.]